MQANKAFPLIHFQCLHWSSMCFNDWLSVTSTVELLWSSKGLHHLVLLSNILCHQGPGRSSLEVTDRLHFHLIHSLVQNFFESSKITNVSEYISIGLSLQHMKVIGDS